jgi:hypothetical protein
MNRADDLRADYDRLGDLLALAEPGAGAAALVRERRIISELLEALERTTEVPLVDQLAGNVVALAPARRARSKAARSSA